MAARWSSDLFIDGTWTSGEAVGTPEHLPPADVEGVHAARGRDDRQPRGAADDALGPLLREQRYARVERYVRAGPAPGASAPARQRGMSAGGTAGAPGTGPGQHAA